MSAAAVDEHLLDARQRLQRLGAAGVGVRSAPRASRRARGPGALSCASSSLARGLRERRILGQEDEAGGEARRERRCPASAATRPQEGLGRLQQQAAAIAGLAVGRDRTAMGQAVERGRWRSAPASGSARRRGWRSARSRSCRARRRPCRVPARQSAWRWPRCELRAAARAPSGAMAPAGSRAYRNSGAEGDPQHWVCE